MQFPLEAQAEFWKQMLMQDKNSLEIADWLAAWINRNVEQRP